jgi:hypothetical protein
VAAYSPINLADLPSIEEKGKITNLLDANSNNAREEGKTALSPANSNNAGEERKTALSPANSNNAGEEGKTVFPDNYDIVLSQVSPELDISPVGHDYDSIYSSKSKDDFLLDIAKRDHEELAPDADNIFIDAIKNEFEEHIKSDPLKLISNSFLDFLKNNREFIEIIKILHAQQFEMTTADGDILNFRGKQKAERMWNIANGCVSILDNVSKVILPFSFNSLLAVPGFVLTGIEFGISFLKKRFNIAVRNKLKNCQLKLKMCQKSGNKIEDDKKNFMFNILHPEIIKVALADLDKIYGELKTYANDNNYDGIIEEFDSLAQGIKSINGYIDTHSILLNILNGAKIIAGIAASVMEIIPFTHEHNLIGSESLKLTPGNVAVLVSSSLALIQSHVEKADRDARYAAGVVKICEIYMSLLFLLESIIEIEER